MKKYLFFIASALIGGLMSLGIYTSIEQKNIPQFPSHHAAPARTVNYSSMPADGTLDFTAAAEKSINAVVHVKTRVSVNPAYNPWLEFFKYQQEPETQIGTGSGVIVSPEGYIVTNNHVVEGAENVQVTLNNNKNYDAEVIGADPSTDIAVLKISENNLPFLEWGSSDDVRIGQWVLAVGNPFELTSTVTAGIVSAKARNINLLNPGYNREIFPIESFIQTDAAVNPGNSGGALVNTSGQLVGINTAIASRTGSYAGYSFAVPSSIARKVAADLVEFGKVQRAFIGVSINDVTEEIAKENGLKEVSGVYVSALTAGGAAIESGIKEGDIILEVNDRIVKNVPELQEQVSKYRPGEKLNVGVWRKGKSQEVVVTLRDKAGNTELAASDDATGSILGARLTEPSEKEKAALGIAGGAKVLEITNGKLKDVGLQQGFIITKIDTQKISDAAQAESLLNKKIVGQTLIIEGYYPNGTKAYYEFRR